MVKWVLGLCGSLDGDKGLETQVVNVKLHWLGLKTLGYHCT